MVQEQDRPAAEEPLGALVASEDGVDVETLSGDVLRAFWKNRAALVGLVVVGTIALLALGAPWLLPGDP